ncbi:MAG: hypothetical protein IT326_06645 [Anaerolineae bacterium]|nr:hypothetical protein [Anaerolineae bacterium]
MIPTLIAALAALLLTGCLVEEAQPELVDPTEFVAYVHSSGVFTLALPPDWIVNDTSDANAINVQFSPPGSPEPLITIYTINLESLQAANPQIGDAASGGLNMDALTQTYITNFYVSNTFVLKDLASDVQPDGSTRLRFLTDSVTGTMQHNDFIQIAGPYFVAMQIRIPLDLAQNRTLGRIVNTLSVNPQAGWTSAVVQPEESEGSSDAIAFTSLNTWVDRSGGFTVAGQVRNNSPGALEFIRINARLVDAQNRVLFEQDDFVSSDLIKPNEYAPFSIVFSDGLPPGTVRFDLSASARYANSATSTFYGADNFALTSGASFDENGLLLIGGQVRNDGNQSASLVKVIVTIFDEEGRVAGTDTTLVDQQRLAPGEATDYSVAFAELGGSANTFLVTVQGIVE